MGLAPGTRLGAYEVVSLLGEGGMGQVYRAKDTRLKRDVALKILPEVFASDPDRIARFQREAELLATLNHPNIAGIYGFEDSGRTHALVLELVEGPTLSDRIAKGRLPLNEALPIAKQIAEALEAAHEQGIIHRDLKPANIKLRPDDTVKVLDFGLAKALEPTAGGAVDVTASPTITSPAMTRMGVILGTAAYMSPEQAKGGPADKRSDVWAFGIVLYEMLTGDALFQSRTLQETLARVLKEEPDLSRVPSEVQPLLRLCLAKDPRRRLRDAADAMLLLDASPHAPPSRATLRWPWPAAAAAFAVVAAVAVWAPWRDRPPEPAATRFLITPPDGVEAENSLKLSPNGRKLAFAAVGRDGRRQLWIRDLDSLTSQPVPGTELQTPFGGAVSWSPNSRFIAFTDGSKLMKADVTSSAVPRTIATLPGVIGETSWSSQGVILVGGITGGPIWHVPDAGGDATPVTAPGPDEGHGFPFFLPDERHFLYHRAGKAPGTYIGSLDLKPEAQTSQRLVACDSQTFFVPSGKRGLGWLLFVRDGRVMAQSFDASRLTLTGEPIMVVTSVGSVGNRALFTASSNGTLAFRAGDEWKFVWLDRQGHALGSMAEASVASIARLSLDGSYVAFDRADPAAGADIWSLELARGVATRLTFDPGRDEFPVWSPDRRRIVFRSNRGGTFDLYEKSVDGTSDDRLVLHTAYEKWPEDWSDDGRYVLYEEITNGQSDLWLLSMNDRRPVPLTHTPFNETFGEFSPDTRWIAYQSNQTGRDEVFVRPLSLSEAGTPTPGGAYQVSQNGGSRPLWRRDGRELVYIGANRTVFAVDVVVSPGIRTGTPRPLFQMPIGSEQYTRLEMDADGQRFLVKAPVQSDRSLIAVIMNWPATMRQ